MTELSIIATFFWVMAGTFQTMLSRRRDKLEERAKERAREKEVSYEKEEERLKNRYDKGQWVIYGFFALALCFIILSIIGFKSVSLDII